MATSSAESDAREHIKVGAIWRRRKTGALLRITHAEDTTSSWNPNAYYDIAWETVERPTRRGKSYEEYWLKNCEPVAVDASTVPPAKGGE